MKGVYPVLLTPGEQYVLVHIPDFNISTQGVDIADAIAMARDAIGLAGIDMEDEHEPVPQGSPLSDVAKDSDADMVTLVDVDFAEYRKMNENRAVKKNCTIPSWLNARAEAAGINFSAVLQAALKRELQLD